MTNEEYKVQQQSTDTRIPRGRGADITTGHVGTVARWREVLAAALRAGNAIAARNAALQITRATNALLCELQAETQRAAGNVINAAVAAGRIDWCDAVALTEVQS